MIKYTPANQISLSGFKHPFERDLLADNRWVKLAGIIPWDDLAAVYATQLNSRRGRHSIDIRMVIGAIIIKHKLGLDDRETVQMISENIYLQYFCGLKSFQTKAPFHPTVFVDIRKRMGASSFDKWNELIIEKADRLKPKKNRQITKCRDDKDQDDDQNKDSDKSSHQGTLKIDATAANQQIAFPTDSNLLNKARKESERLIDELYKLSGLRVKPRTYRREAATGYLAFSKKRRKSSKTIRSFNKKQLNYLRRNFKSIDKLLDLITDLRKSPQKVGMFDSFTESNLERFPLKHKDQKIYWIIQELYRQQKEMHDQNKHSVSNRIVNIYQPYVRPIVRGKDGSQTEFGAKLSASEVDGMSRVEHISWDNFNESTDLKLQVRAFKKTYGHYPELLLADKIYFNRENRRWLKEKGIRIVGKTLGRKPKEEKTAYQLRKIKKERNQRNLIEGKFGQGKKAYGLNKIKAKTRATSESWISAIFFIMNLISLQKIADKYAIFCALFKNWLKSVYFNLNLIQNETKIYNQPA